MKTLYIVCSLILLLGQLTCAQSLFAQEPIDITEAALTDKIRGGIIGQFFGNLNGLKHENQYFEEPGKVTEYTPDLSDGAFTDDDTDIEFVYIYHMANAQEAILPYDQIGQLWRENINDKIWCSNRYARNMMDLGFEPPHTGRIAFNPWADFNISGQFLCEEFALISPGMPQTAARIGAHYTHVAIDGEPTQTTQLYDAMISAAFFEEDPLKIIDTGLAAIDPGSEIHGIVSHVKAWYEAHPDDWRATRLSIKHTYWDGTWGGPGGSNGYRTITAATIGALLHGEGDFVESIRLAFNFGWDADNISAMVGTIMGVIKGEAWIRSQGWPIKDEYRNTRRPGLPTDLTITDFADLHIQIAHRLILENGGKQIEIDGKPGFRILTQAPAVVEPLPAPLNRIDEMRDDWMPQIIAGLNGDTQAKARAAYASICLDLSATIANRYPAAWEKALDALEPHYEALFADEQWGAEAHTYFDAVVHQRNPHTSAPFGYPSYRASSPHKVILDTDPAYDPDDVGCMAMLQTMANRDECEILAIVNSTNHKESPLCISAINQFYNRKAIPVGDYKGYDQKVDAPADVYDYHIAQNYPHSLHDWEDAPDAVQLYREILASAADSSITIVIIGTMHNFYGLLTSRSGPFSEKSGVQLVREKVRQVVTMGGNFIDGRGLDRTNWGGADSLCAYTSWSCLNESRNRMCRYVIEHCPAPFIASGWEVGCGDYHHANYGTVVTGQGLKELDSLHIVRKSYEYHFASRGGSDNISRHSNDQCALHYAVRGEGENYDAFLNGTITLSPSGECTWNQSRNRRQGYIQKKRDKELIAAEIEDLMMGAVMIPDNSPPLFPGEASFQADGDHLYISWPAAGDPDPGSWVVSYNLYRDGKKLGTAHGLQFYAPLDDAHAHEYEIRAVNCNGIESTGKAFRY